MGNTVAATEVRSVLDGSVISQEGDDLPLPLAWEPASSPGLRRTAISASVYLFLVYLAYAMSFTPFPELTLQWACEDNGLSWDSCNKDDGGDTYTKAQKEATNFQQVWMITTGVLQVAVCCFYGVLGDSYGRRLPLLMPLCSAALQGLALGLVPSSRKYDLLLVLGFITSIGGGTYVTNHAGCATIADMTQQATPEERSYMFGLIEAATWGGLLLGPFVGGSCAKWFGNQHAILATVVVGLVNLLFSGLFYKDTLEEARRKPFSWRRANPIAAYANFFHNRFVFTLGLMLFFAMLSTNGSGAILPNVMNYQIPHLDPQVLGLTQTIQLGSGCVGLVFIFPCLVKCMKLQTTCQISMMNIVVAWLVLSFATVLWEFMAIQAGFVLIAVVYPVMRAGLTLTFGRHRYGEALASMGTLEQTMQLIAPVIMQSVYHATLTTSFGPVHCITFLVGSGVAFIGLIISFFIGDFPGNMQNTFISSVVTDVGQDATDKRVREKAAAYDGGRSSAQA